MDIKAYNPKMLLQSVVKIQSPDQKIKTAKLLMPTEMEARLEITSGGFLTYKTVNAAIIGNDGERGRESRMHRIVAELNGKQYDGCIHQISCFFRNDKTETTWEPNGRLVQVPEHILHAETFAICELAVETNPLCAAMTSAEVFQKIKTGILRVDNGEVFLNR